MTHFEGGRPVEIFGYPIWNNSDDAHERPPGVLVSVYGAPMHEDHSSDRHSTRSLLS